MRKKLLISIAGGIFVVGGLVFLTRPEKEQSAFSIMFDSSTNFDGRAFVAFKLQNLSSSDWNCFFKRQIHDGTNWVEKAVDGSEAVFVNEQTLPSFVEPIAAGQRKVCYWPALHESNKWRLVVTPNGESPRGLRRYRWTLSLALLRRGWQRTSEVLYPYKDIFLYSPEMNGTNLILDCPGLASSHR